MYYRGKIVKCLLSASFVTSKFISSGYNARKKLSFFKNYVPFTDPYSLKHLLVNKISIDAVLMRQRQTNLIVMNNVLFRSDFKFIFYLFSLQKFSNF